MKEPQGLTVLEGIWCHGEWMGDEEGNIQGECIPFTQMRDGEFYRKQGVYEKMGLPVELRQPEKERWPELSPCQAATRAFAWEARRAVEKNHAFLAVGSYCNMAPAILGGVQQAVGTEKEIGLVWMDAHGDNHILEGSGRQWIRLVSTPLSMIAGQTMEKLRKEICLLEKPCRGENILAGDVRILGEESGWNLCRAGIRRLDSSDFGREEVWRREVEQLAGRVDVIYLAIDADILKAEAIPAYIKAVPYGQEVETVARNAGIVMDTGKVAAVSLFCFDFDRYDQGGEQTYASGAAILGECLSRWQYCGR